MKKLNILRAARTPCGIPVRLQKRGEKFDVISNATGIAWRYVVKGVSEPVALATFNRETVAGNTDETGRAP